MVRINFLTIVLCAACSLSGCTQAPDHLRKEQETPSIPAIGANPKNVTAEDLFSIIQIKFEKRQYNFSLDEAKDGISIPYKVNIPLDVDSIVPVTQMWGNAGRPNSYGLILFAELIEDPWDPAAGTKRHYYAIKDIGLDQLDREERQPLTIKKGNHLETFEWSGRNWLGPSDTSTKPGEPFPVREYKLTVSCKGFKMINGKDSKFEFTISNAVKIVLTK